MAREQRINTINLYWKSGETEKVHGTVHFTKDNSNVICITKLDRSKWFVPISNLNGWTFSSTDPEETDEN